VVPIDESPAKHPPLDFKGLQSYSPHLIITEKFRTVQRRRATHDHRLFESQVDLKRSLRVSLCFCQIVRGFMVCSPRATTIQQTVQHQRAREPDMDRPSPAPATASTGTR
jgi:hypothetical protein